ncbi:thioredoxin family protein [Candidatus Dojkabacteria bacterium]|nr:thioredoxin family protein [Candidatus Dojkabacteria bacterium]
MKVLKFGAIWCSGCLIMKPIWQQIESELKWLKTEYYDVDENADLVKKYDITEFPCFIFLDKNGTEIHREYGEIEKKNLIKIINEYKDS